VIPYLQDSFDEGGKAVLQDMNFMKNLLNFEKDQITEETMELLEPYMNQREDWFTEEAGQKVSKAAAGIMAWSFAIHLYHVKSKIVKPKQAFLLV
jgi:dynein heavy chain